LSVVFVERTEVKYAEFDWQRSGLSATSNFTRVIEDEESYYSNLHFIIGSVSCGDPVDDASGGHNDLIQGGDYNFTTTIGQGNTIASKNNFKKEKGKRLFSTSASLGKGYGT